MKWKDDDIKYTGIKIQKDTPKETVELILNKQTRYPFHVYGFICIILSIGCYFLPIEQDTIDLSFAQVGKVTGGISACLVLLAGFLFWLHYSQTVTEITK